jgi:hypothetical protein
VIVPIDSIHLLRVAARTTGGDRTVAVEHLDVSLADSMAIGVRTEAALLRRTAVAVDSASRNEFRKCVKVTRLATDRLDELKAACDLMTNLSADLDRMQRQHRAP